MLTPARAERLSGSLQENLITLLGYSDDYGKVLTGLVNVELFEGDYQLIAMRCIDYWRRENQAPKHHLPDLFADILEDAHDRRAPGLRRILLAMLELHEGINAPYVLREIRTFERTQRLKIAVLKAAEALDSPRPDAINEVEELLADVTRARDFAFDAGVRLYDVDRVLHTAEEPEEFDLGIELFDNLHIVPKRKTIITLIGPSGVGKSWFLVHCGKRAFFRRKKVLHITLELSQDKTLMRYLQSIYGIPRRYVESVDVATLDWNEAHSQLIGLSRERVNVDFALDSRDAQLELEVHGRGFGHRLANVVIKEFPGSSLTTNMLNGFLDQLELVENFVPDMLVVDYPKLMKLSLQNLRLDLGQTFVELRGICQERNMAGVFVHQSSRAGAEAKHVRATHAAEDFSVVQTSDVVFTHSATQYEQRSGLARLFADKVRDEQAKVGVVATQNYTLGQYVIDAAPLGSAYYEYLEDLENRSRHDQDQDEGAQE